MKVIKYFFGFIVPSALAISVFFNGVWSYSALLIGFVFIPLAELIMPQSTANFTKAEEKIVKKKSIYDWILYIQLPMLFGVLMYFLHLVTTQTLPLVDLIGKSISIGIGCGVMGIGIGHELGHRHKKYEQYMAKAYLMCTNYMHFFIEHNRGHHKNIATPNDPATARRGESIYAYWLRSVTTSYLSAWRLENNRLKRKKISIISIQNEMIQMTAIQIAFFALIFILFGVSGLAYFFLVSTIGFLSFEVVNYIEHYGLTRKEIQPGVYEKTMPHHSWNSNHPLGRLVMYEVTRHSDHHFHAGRKYQILRHFDEAPQMPTGYPGMMMIAMFPPLWFSIMHKHIDKHLEALQIHNSKSLIVA